LEIRKIKKSNRKTIAIHIKNGEVEVRCPMRTSQRQITDFVNSKKNWIEKHLASQLKNVEKREDFTVEYGSELSYLGKKYPIIATENKNCGFSDNAFRIPNNLENEDIKRFCISIYKNLAKIYLTKRTVEFSEKMDTTFKTVKITSAKTRWGSCSSKKSINYCWRLIMADSDVVDYVIVHELAHTFEFNHSESFWRIVENIIPNYKELKFKLKELQSKLNTENWEQ
jgi:predicted metal-dependent hydrolase